MLKNIFVALQWFSNADPDEIAHLSGSTLVMHLSMCSGEGGGGGRGRRRQLMKD